ncbi:Bromo adjacent homology (BAH) domain-containing protein [Cynara cardunculus var. scolymus]|uniref:Bromo adjacent homology (BAH) domain-containing protein n=1 Tax=Cynara cardunculus var. scolymus TaxID=59895 RepID=A0A103Y4E5_CYNCS|nr:Bromo adjacent homology (BAH) domain-containing protein [Cynara cardunculus var. scolymus]
MDEMAVDASMDVSEVRSGSLGEKRSLEDVIERDLCNKKARGGSDRGMAFGVKKVAEMVLVLATMAEMRGGRKPTAVEMEKSEVFPIHAATYTPRVAESRSTSHSVRTFPSGKVDHAPVSSGSFQHQSTVVHASPVSNSRTLPYQLPTSEIRPGGSNVLPGSHLGRNSTALPIPQGGRPHLRSEEISNAKPAGDHGTSNTPTWSVHSQSISFAKPGSDKGSAHLTNINHHVRHRMNFVQSPVVGTHNEISKIVQKILQPHMAERVTWTPPSRDYMNKALTCQTCKGMINEVDTALVCDACERGYHLRCLHCNPKAICGDEWHEWHCAKCLAISNGKPLPPKYGRVMRNISTPKMSSGMSGVQPSLEKKLQSSDEKFNQQLMTANSNPGSQSVPSEIMRDNNGSTDMKINGIRECGIETSSSEKCEKKLESHKPANSEALNSLSDHLQPTGNHQDNNQEGMLSTTDTLECNPKGEIREDEKGVEKGNMVKTSETCTQVGEEEGSSSNSMHDVEWVGGMLNEEDGKSFYRSCCISGIGMWEDSKTSKKWVTVTRCFFPGDLPEGVGRPCAPESNEVYESNHETTLAAGLIRGPCEVFPPCKLSEERVMQTRSWTTTSDKPKPLFLCKWFYDEKKRLFRDVTC